MLHHYPLSPNVTAFSTLRQGGVSQGEYASFNINPHSGDSPAAVDANKELLAKALQLSEQRILLPHQTHGTEIRIVADAFFELPTATQQMLLEGVDGLATQCRGLCIGVSTADCVPLLLWDEEHRAVAALHAGWRGTLQRMAERGVRQMNEWFATSPQHLHAVIGPCISLPHFGVGDEVYQQFADTLHPMDRIAQRIDGQWHLNLPLANRLQLERLGVPAAHIHCSNLCSWEQPQQFFSARRQGINSGRTYTAIMIH